jgi:hypothetical protein
VNDTATEGAETFAVQISATLAGSSLTATKSTATATIAANDDPVSPVQTPFNGTPFQVNADPTTIAAIQFDNGGQGVAYSDDAGRRSGAQPVRTETDVEVSLGDAVNGPAIGWTRTGEWLEYTIDVAQAGAYALEFRMAGLFTGRNIEASFAKDGTVYETSGLVVSPVTGAYSVFTDTNTVVVDLDDGIQVVRLTFGGANHQDLQSFTLDLLDTGFNAFAAEPPLTQTLIDDLRL